MKHAEEFQELWESLVPDGGQAATVQGELIRSVGRLRDEAERNGNANWDEGYELFCDFIEITFRPLRMADPHARERIEVILNRMRQPNIAYLDYALFDELEDYAVDWCKSHPEPIPKPNDPRQYR
ncbi:hypothetical protein [Saccharibacillus endophyticus]|uniref:Uncharacterized protein n=1 Tax=Saccharibacillus endophyticus TaxID=2060666 RepID=A0ABQ1ZYA0_9BACL|nr:hypothetical protein [Saccharibacillus endophyticus]GGH79966.1 hypothetical protein GCM10007362_27560 [Saccharibacillus endophyticus]